jgi:hypothetical protein
MSRRESPNLCWVLALVAGPWRGVGIGTIAPGALPLAASVPAISVSFADTQLMVGTPTNRARLARREP